MLALPQVLRNNLRMFKRIREKIIDHGERVPIYKQQECLGEACTYYSGIECSSRLELLRATGKSGGKDKGPLREDCSYALYGQVCMGGEEQVVVRLHSESPNGQASLAELVGRSGMYEEQKIVLTTPAENIIFE